MGWQKDDIEELADELGIDGGDSSSQQDRLRKISEQVGMDSFNGLSNADTNELQQRLKARRNQNNNNRNNNNFNNHRSHFLNKHHNRYRNSRQNNGGVEGNNSSSSFSNERTRSGFENSQIKGDFTIKIPIKIQIILYGVIILIPLFSLLMIVVLFNDEMTGSGGGFAYGQTCTKVTVINTDCDSNNENCTNKYNGELELEDYIAGVVAAESKGNTNQEYLKLLSIATRTNFIDQVDSSCTVEGNSNFQTYIDVNDSSNSSQVKQAVEDTKNFIVVSEDNMIDIQYGYGQIDHEDSDNYYISYGQNYLDSTELKAIPKSWADNQSIFKNYLDNWETLSESDVDLSLIGALYLITNEGYNYQSVIEHYYGQDVEVIENAMLLSGVDGYMNPTTSIHCSSAFGYRTHPVTGELNSFHGGLDIGVYSPIYAAKDGTISRVVDYVTIINATESNYESGYGYGNNIIINHGDGTSTLYAHIEYGSIPDYVYAGATIKQGQQIGYTGSTGRSTGVHLHYEVRVNDEKVDPADYLDLTNASGTCRK